MLLINMHNKRYIFLKCLLFDAPFVQSPPSVACSTVPVSAQGTFSYCSLMPNRASLIIPWLFVWLLNQIDIWDYPVVPSSRQLLS